MFFIICSGPEVYINCARACIFFCIVLIMKSVSLIWKEREWLQGQKYPDLSIFMFKNVESIHHGRRGKATSCNSAPPKSQHLADAIFKEF